jgi:hypothetical protein
MSGEQFMKLAIEEANKAREAGGQVMNTGYL